MIDNKQITREDGEWMTIKSGDSEGLSRQFKCGKLAESVIVAGSALQVIQDAGYDESSILFFDCYECSVSIHVGLDGEVTDEYKNLAAQIDKAVSHVR